MFRRRQDRQALRRARDLLLDRGELPLCDSITPVIARSWKRSLEAGVSPTGKLTDVVRLEDAEFARAKEKRRQLLSYADPVMKYLLRTTRDAGGIAILTDERAVVLEVLGDANFLTRAERIALAPGASWDERYRGTNGVGTALIEEHAVVVNGAEHFLDRNGFLSCTAVPIAGPDGTILGAIDISLTERMHHPHTLGLLQGAANIMEIRLFAAHHARDLQLRFHPDAAGLGTFAEGVVALAEGGALLGANRAGLAYLGLRAADLRTIVSIETLLPLRLTDLLDWSRHRPNEPMLVTLPDGERLFIRIVQPGCRRGAPPIERRGITRDALDDLKTGDQQFAEIADKARKLVAKSLPLLLIGEPGTGKGRFAKAVHAAGPRHGGPFIVVDCAAIAPSEIDVHLFGRIASNNQQAVIGALQEVDGGTLYLDGIEALPRRLQLEIVGMSKGKRFVPFGGTTSITTDFALISSSCRSLKAGTDDADIGNDFYHLLVGFTLQIPPLRCRQDLPTLISRKIEEFAPDRGICLDPAVATAFAEYQWPGNLRELRNVLCAACLLLDDHETQIGWQHLPCDLVQELRDDAMSASRVEGRRTVERLHQQTLQTMEHALALCGGNYSEAARRLGVSRATLYRKLGKNKRAAGNA